MDTPSAPKLPTEFTIVGRVYEGGSRTYELVPLFKEGERSVSGKVMVKRAEELGANLGQDDGQFILEHQNEIPQELRWKIYLVFTDWRDPSNPQIVASLRWLGSCWELAWSWLAYSGWSVSGRLVRRKT